jgi:hypothetical protein
MSLAGLPMEEMKAMFGAFLAELLKLSRELGSRSPLTNRLPTLGDCSGFLSGDYGGPARPEGPSCLRKADLFRKVYRDRSTGRSKLPVVQSRERGVIDGSLDHDHRADRDRDDRVDSDRRNSERDRDTSLRDRSRSKLLGVRHRDRDRVRVRVCGRSSDRFYSTSWDKDFIVQTMSVTEVAVVIVTVTVATVAVIIVAFPGPTETGTRGSMATMTVTGVRGSHGHGRVDRGYHRGYIAAVLAAGELSTVVDRPRCRHADRGDRDVPTVPIIVYM